MTKHDEYTKKQSRKILHININTSKFYEISKGQKTKEFKEKCKNRAYHEAKNGEMKRFHMLVSSLDLFNFHKMVILFRVVKIIENKV